jgi:hypothetical protein
MLNKLTYKSIKVRLKKILKKDVDYSYLHNVIDRTNELVINCYFFLRSYLLYIYELNKNDNNFAFQEITNGMITMAFKVLSKSSVGQKPKGNNKVYYDFMNRYYCNTYVKKLYPNININNNTEIENTKFNAVNLRYVIGDIVTEMLTCIENTIKYGYFKYLNSYVRKSFQDEIDKQLKIVPNKEKKSIERKLKAEIKKVIDDILNDTKLSENKYHEWIVNNKSKLVPQLEKGMTHENYIDMKPHIYLKYLMNMAKSSEEKGWKVIQVFPQRTQIIPKYININTSALIDIFSDKNKSIEFKTVSKDESEQWKKYFNISDKTYSYKDHSFNHQIQTDGYSVSILFINNKCIANKKAKIKAKTEGRNESRNQKKEMTEEEYDEYKKNKENKKKEKRKEQNKKRTENIKKKKEEFKKLTEKEQNEIKLKMRLNNEFPYIEDIVKIETERKKIEEHINAKNIAVADPGKRSILYIKGFNGKYYDYTNKRRLKETKRLKYNQLIENRKKQYYIGNNTIKEIESKLNVVTGKTIDYNKYMTYVKQKLEQNKILKSEYENEYYRKLKWYSYLNKKKHENKILNELRSKYGKKCVMIVGDWNESEKIKFISTPGIGMKRKLKEAFTVYHIDEFRTSKLHYKTETECENFEYKYKHKTTNEEGTQLVHSVLIYKLGRESGCINRDRNSVNNMEKIVRELVSTGERPEKYRREKKVKTIKTVKLCRATISEHVKTEMEEGTNRVKKRKQNEKQKAEKTVNEKTKKVKIIVKAKRENHLN